MPLSKLRSLAVGALLLAAAPALAQTYHVGALRIANPWIRPTPRGAPTAAGYLTVTNTGAHPDRLLGGSSPSAAAVEIHLMTMTGDIMRMRPVAGGLVIPPGRTVSIEPGGYHLMLMAPRRPFAPGQKVPATLRFERAGSVTIVFSVQPAPPPGEGASHPMSMR
jgi:copper(I)-binding protein